jgi:hypothetical protein
MAEGDTPFDVTPKPPAAQGAPQPDIAQQWASFMGQPGATAALLNAGISLMQPPSFGDTFASQLGRAIGAGGEAATRGEVLESKIGESEARSEAARSRAGEAGARLETSLERTRLQNRVKLIGEYNKYRHGIDEANRKAIANWEKATELDRLAGKTPSIPRPEPVMPDSQDVWIDKQERLTGGLQIPPAAGGGGGRPSGNAGPAPQNPSDRRAGQVYDTPKGPLRWTGSGWVSP